MRGRETKSCQHLQSKLSRDPTAARVLQTRGVLWLRARDNTGDRSHFHAGELPRGLLPPSPASKGTGGPQSGLRTRRPPHRAHAKQPLTTDADLLGSGRRPGHEQGAAEGVGAVTPGLGPTRTPAWSRAGRHSWALSVASSVPQPEPAPAPNPGGAARVSGHRGPLRPRRPPALCSPPPLALPRPPLARPSGSPARAPPRPASLAAMNM